MSLLLAASSVAAANQRSYYFKPVDSQNTLASASVTALFQDHVGYVWIATQSGLQRFDGYRYLQLRHDPDDPDSLPGSFVTALAQDRDDRLWVGSLTHGLAALDPASARVVTRSRISTSDSQPRDAIGALAYDPKRGLWIGNAAGIELMDMDSGKRRAILKFDGTGNHNVSAFALSSDGTLWSATSNGLFRIGAHTDIAQRVAARELALTSCVLVDSAGIVYVGATDGLYRIDRQQLTARRVWPNADGLAGEGQVNAMVQDRRGRLWLSIPGAGLKIYDPSSGSVHALRQNSGIPGTLPDDNVMHLLLDRSGLLWVGGDISGVSTVDPNGAQFRFIADTTPGRAQKTNSIRAIIQDSDGTLWLGTEGDGLKSYDPANDRFEYFDDVFKVKRTATEPVPQWHITALANASEHRLWLASNHGAFLFDPKLRKATPLSIADDGNAGLTGKPVRTVLAARDGSVWIGTYDSGLAHLWPKTGTTSKRWQTFRHDPNDARSLANNSILSLYQDRANRVWIGTLNGLSVYDPARGKFNTFRHESGNRRSLGDNLIRILFQSGDGVLWVGTQSGLDRVDNPDTPSPGFIHYSTKTGLPGATVLGIQEDRQHNIWVSTNQGIAVYNRSLAAFSSFTLRDGLQGREFNAGASYQLGDGELAFGGLHGLNIFNPDAIRHDPYMPPIVITGADLGNANLDFVPVSGISMSQSQRVLRFEFAALDYSDPLNNRFSYRLRGFDPDWISAFDHHTATYTNLPAGDYVFEVRGSNADQVWNTTGTSVAVHITPPWWASRSMKLLYLTIGAIVASLLWLTYRRRRQRELHYHHELRDREDRLRLALWGSGDEFWDWDMRDGVIYRVGADQLIGGRREDSLSADDWKHHAVHPDDLAAVEQRLFDHVEGRKRFFESEHRIRTMDGDWIWVLSRGKVVELDENGKALRVCGTARNITAARTAERERRIATEVIDSMSEAVAVTNLDFCFVSVNRAFTRMFGYTEAEIVAQPASLLDSLRHEREHYQAMRNAFLASGHWHGELWQRRKDGEEFLSWIEISEVRDAAGERTHYVGVINDITQRKRTEQELRYLANYDTLTGLPNRTLLGERLAHAVIRARRTSRKVALLFLDLDRFKHVNDSMGHAIGDRVLKTVGERLRASVSEAATVARLGGDEFTVVLEDVKDADEPLQVANQLLEVFSTPLNLDSGQQVMISPSIGISVYPDHAQVPTDLLKCADTAMYQAKEAGRNMYQVYTSAMDVNARQRAGMLGALRLAIERDEFRIVYQPMLDLDGGHITGVEALLRWNSAEFGEVGPAVFIPLAEEAGLIERIGEFVLYRACAQLREWLGRGLTNFTMSVNLSALQLLRNELTQRLCEILAELNLAPESLELELTESVLMANPELAIHTLDRLHSLGVAIAIDDFGTGYSSLSYLKRLPIDTLKIDRSFVGDITTDPDDEAITKTIISMAHSLGLDVVAEGVETLEQLEYLHEQGCDVIQGHWLSPPLDAAACFTFIREFVRSRPPAQPRRKLR
ncbi:MAG: EAL domain-containing protein [Rudaea sp.]